MKVLRGIFAKFLFLLVIVGLLYFLKSNIGGINNITGLTVFNADLNEDTNEENLSENVNKLVYENISLPDVYFCPRYNCSGVIVDLINSAEKSVHCALFDLDLYEIIEAMDMKINAGIDVKVVVDNDNYKEIEESYGKSISENFTIVKQDNSNQLSHNKFCVVDRKIVATGSFNPTFNDNNKNNNNLVVITSAYLSENYEDEFDELWGGKFGKGGKVKYPKLISAENNLSIENYFCPEDKCEKHVLDVLDKANKSIRFMLFSFTSDEIGDKLIEMSKKEVDDKAIDVKGIVEKKQNTNQYSEYKKMNDAGIDIKYDTNPYNMHHKVFIIDDETVITGSYNPTSAGTNKNDENIVIMHNKEIAEKFINEFLVVSGGIS